jgi:hypothetical protein
MKLVNMSNTLHKEGDIISNPLKFPLLNGGAHLTSHTIHSNVRQASHLEAALYREQEHNKPQTQRSTFTTPGQPGRLIN